MPADTRRDSPWLFTCRHTHELRLCEELARLGCERARPVDGVPGLVRADGLPSAVDDDTLKAWDPVWALQVLPAVELLPAPSINALAAAVVARLSDAVDGFDGPWVLHVVAPGRLRGQPNPKLAGRAELVDKAIGKRLGKSRRRAWKRRQHDCPQPEFVAQVLLRDPRHAWLAFGPTRALPTGRTWPSPMPAGLADVADDPVAPSSAFRKLDEAFACIGRTPQPCETGVDLGASPGGWTRVLLRHGARVVAVDRAPLAAHLGREPAVTWLKGDAFTFRPDAPVDWLVSDIIAFPARVAELLELWCGERLATRLVVQMKFTGDTDWDALDAALRTAERHGYHCRAKHFFNDKNEVTLMVCA